MPGLELIGPVAGKPAVPAQEPAVVDAEATGMFLLGDAWAMRHYSGRHLGWRWLCRAQGPLLDRVAEFAPWPFEGGRPFLYTTKREVVQAFHGAVRAHAMKHAMGLRAVDGRDAMPLNDPTCVAERFWWGQEEVLRLFYDHMTDLQTTMRNTDDIWLFDAHPDDPQQGTLAAFESVADVLYLAVARGASGAAEHLVLVHNSAHRPQPTVQEGMPRAEWIKAYERAAVTFPSGVAIVQWGRLSGPESMCGEDRNDPASTLRGKFPPNAVAIPLPAPADIQHRLGNLPAAWAVRMEPGEYTLTYYRLDTQRDGAFDFCALSRRGAPSFMPAVLGTAAGLVIEGLTMEQYAMLSAERDALLMRVGAAGAASAAMAALCSRYGVPFRNDVHAAMNGRLQGWEQTIHRDASFGEQWAVQLGAARMRLSGGDPNAEATRAAAFQQQVAQQQAHDAHQRETLARLQRGAAQLFERARARLSPAQLVAACGEVAPGLVPKDVLSYALEILKNPREHGRVEGAKELTEPLARAHWLTLEEPQRRAMAGGREASYVREVLKGVGEAQGFPPPAAGGFLSRLVDKI